MSKVAFPHWGGTREGSRDNREEEEKMGDLEKQLDILAYADRLIAGHTASRFSFPCTCYTCDHRKEEHLGSTEETRAWLEKHVGHEVAIGIRVEGIVRRAASPLQSRWKREMSDEKAAEMQRVIVKIEKLYRLANHSIFEKEAEVALSKIQALLRRFDLSGEDVALYLEQEGEGSR